MRRSVIVEVVVRVVYHSALLLGLFLLFTGHHRPGGGFVGGLVAGAGISLRYLSGGIDEVREAVPLRPWTILGSGLVVAATSTLLPLVAGRELMEHFKFDLHLGIMGEAHINTALMFDIGVALVVVGTILMLLVAFGEQMPTLFNPYAAPAREPSNEEAA